MMTYTHHISENRICSVFVKILRPSIDRGFIHIVFKTTFDMQTLALSIIVLSILSFAAIASAEEYTVSIPFGAYNPNIDTPTKYWYDPPILSVKSGDTVTWENGDIEAHTVTSGKGAGRFGWMGNQEFGTPDGKFDSGRFMPEESWSHTFDSTGTFHYFCTIHPWMEGAVLVGSNIPDYAHDAYGNRIEKFPVIMYTYDDAVEVDLTWEPNVIKTYEPTKFIFQFYDKESGVNLGKMDYDFTIIQNGVEIFQSEGTTTVGGDFRNFVFENPGPIIIKFRNIQSGGPIAESKSLGLEAEESSARSAEFTTVVYDNPEGGEVIPVAQPAQRLEIHYGVLVAIVLIPGVLFAFVIYQMKKHPSKTKH